MTAGRLRSLLRRGLVALTLACATAALHPFAANAQSAALKCKRLAFPVAPNPDASVDQSIAGWLCARGAADSKTLQVLVPGASYDHNYWNFPLDPDRYSYVSAATASGYATLALDPLGAGQSSYPNDPTLLNLHVEAYTIHQVIEAVRSGVAIPDGGKYRASRILLVGHSLGSFAASIEAGTYRDVDGVILSGFAHSLGPGVITIESSTIPAELDPKFAPLSLPAGYLTTRAGTRAADFYYTPNADPAVIALDEQLKQTFTDGQVADIATSETASKRIIVPTLVAVGAHDSLYCAQLPCSTTGSLSREASYYSPQACVQTDVIPGSGHDLNLQLNAPAWFNAAIAWANEHVGADMSVPQRCRAHVPAGA